ncbi:MAG TPA: DsbA family oxidoreductase [Alphaproteobacteria bacterium]|nr:DsbA family oxidoreductase [Alphaproteobacteria bacterium]
MIKIDIVSDAVCPWCYIGKKRLDKALNKYKKYKFDINWHAFQLNPSMPRNGMDRKQYLFSKFGGENRATDIYKQIELAGLSSGIEFNFGQITTMPNSFFAHILIEYSKEEYLQSDITEKLFNAFFIEGKNIGNIEVLLEIARKSNIKNFSKNIFSERKDIIDNVQISDNTNRKKGISGVPFFIINNNYAVSGAQESEVFEKVFETCLLEEKN